MAGESYPLPKTDFDQIRHLLFDRLASRSATVSIFGDDSTHAHAAVTTGSIATMHYLIHLEKQRSSWRVTDWKHVTTPSE
jgi:hypothetical protein